jgi:hypothetical protein
MKTEQIVKELRDAAKQLGLEVRAEKGHFRGGRCMVGGQEFIVLNRLHIPAVQLNILAECLKELPIDTLFLKPVVRKALEDTWDAQEAMMAEEVDVLE